MNFNIFTILSKDNKELIHSAFIKFLLEEDTYFSKNLLGQELKLERGDIKLEKRLTKKHRIDLFIQKSNSDQIFIIENKFKCLPTADQLVGYSNEIKNEYKGKTVSKYLLYFKEGIGFKLPEDWKIFTYEKVHETIQSYLEHSYDIDNDKRIFMEHYIEFLKEYIDVYKEIMNNPENIKNVFLNQFHRKGKIQIDNGYWLNLIFHELALILEKKNFPIYIGSGYTYKPLINVMPWGEKNMFVIQLNGKGLKYYAHLKGLENKQYIIDEKVKFLKKKGFDLNFTGEFKKKLKEKNNTGFIYKENITEVLAAEHFTIEGIANFIEEFYLRIKRVEQPVV